MSELAAISCLRLAPDELRGQLRALLGQPLRRAGSFGRLCVAGVVSCAGVAQAQTTALLWSSAYGARAEVHAVLQELAKDVELMPFDFIASLPVVAAIHAAQHAPRIKFGVFLPAMADAPETWPRLLQLALCWLDEGRCERVICGWVEEAQNQPGDHTSHWLALTRAGLAAAPLARVQLVCNEGENSARWLPSRFAPVAGKGAELVPALQTWLAGEASVASKASRIAKSVAYASTQNSALVAPIFSVGQIQFSRIAPD